MAKNHKIVGGGVPVPPKKSGSNKTLFIVLGLVVFFIFVLPALLFGGALLWFKEKGAESIIENATGTDVDINDGSYTFRGENGEELNVSTEQKLPDDFPSEVPLYPGQTIRSTFKTKDDNSASWSFTASTKDSREKVAGFIAEQFGSWQNGGEYSVNDLTSISYEKGDLNLVIGYGNYAAEAGSTSITYTVNKKIN